jgi:hypothetical protein
MALARLGWPAEVPALRLWPIDARVYATRSTTEVAADRARPIGKGTGWYFLLLVKRAAACDAVRLAANLLCWDWLRK